MANPLQPKVIKRLETKYSAYVINLNAASKSGHMDIIACIKGLFYGFEVKWKNDKPNDLQRDKINNCIDAGGKAYFIRSIEELDDILLNNIPPVKYAITIRFKL